ncbi:kinase-like protein [Aspergillus californicus]
MSESASETKCVACSWTESSQNCCSYSSHVKLFYGAGPRGAWSIGSEVILKERPDAGAEENEARNTGFVKQHTTIPAPEILQDWLDDSGRYFILSKRMQGETLEKAWSTLSAPQKEKIADQVADVDEGSVYSGWLFLDNGEGSHGPLKSEAETRDYLTNALKEKSVPLSAVSRLMSRLPPCAPYTFTHGDLKVGNFIVKDGELVGILDWESAAYFPWKALLRGKLDCYEEAKKFWWDFYSLKWYPKLNERGQAVLDASVQAADK